MLGRPVKMGLDSSPLAKVLRKFGYLPSDLIYKFRQNMFWLIIILLILFWGGGFLFLNTSLIHLLLIVAFVLIVIRLTRG